MALLNAIDTVFPKASHFICSWHMRKDIKLNLQKKTELDADATDEFMKNWNTIVKGCPSDQILEQKVKELLSNLSEKHTGLMSFREYVWGQWMSKKHLWSREYTDRVTHFGILETQIVESLHQSIKRTLKTRSGNLRTLLDDIDRTLNEQHQTRSYDIDKEVTRLDNKLREISFLKPVCGKITNYVLEIVATGMKTNASELGDRCTCITRKTMGIPCPHEVQTLLEGKDALSEDDFHSQWHLLPFFRKVVSVWIFFEKLMHMN